MVDALTTRELEVLELMAKGMTHKQIAGELCIAYKTARIHACTISAKPPHSPTRRHARTSPRLIPSRFISARILICS